MFAAAARRSLQQRSSSSARIGQQFLYRRTMADMPVPQSSKAILFDGHPAREGWESTMAMWYGSSLVLLVATLGMTPDTDIETWARQEAAARLAAKEATAEPLEFGMHASQSQKETVANAWEKFTTKATRWGEDDDDDDDEDDDE